MGKIDFAPGSKVYFENEAFKIVRAVNFSTVSIRAVEDENKIINVPIADLHLESKAEKVYVDHYTDEEWSEAKERYEAIKSLVFRNKSRAAVEAVANSVGKSVTTIYGWIKTYEQSEQISSLVSNTKGRGRSGSRLDGVVDKIINDVLEELYLTKQKTGFSKIAMQINKECKRLGLKPPHDNTIRNRIKAIDPKLAMKKREGYKKAHKEFSNFEGEFPEGNYPLEVFQVDHTPLDIMVVDSTFRKPIGRPYLTLAIDVYSRMIAGIYVSLQAPGYFNVSQCLYNAFLPKEKFLRQYGVEGAWNVFGLPRQIAVDNGKDLVGADMQRVCDEFGITLLKRPVARPQFGAHVERVLGTINKAIHDLPGTTFSNVNEKGEYDSVKNATFTLEEITHWLVEYIVNVYHKRVHHGLGMTPERKYEIGIFGDDENPGTGILPSIIENEEEIRVVLLPTFYRTVQKDGITLDGITYYSDVLRTWINRKDDKGNKLKFKIKRDPLDIQKLYFYDPQLNEYFELHYRRLNAPKMTLWDLYAAKRYLKENRISDVNEEDIFDAYERLTEIEQRAKEKTKTQLRKSKAPKMSDKAVQKGDSNKEEENQELVDEVLEDLFSDIETFDVFERPSGTGEQS